MLRHEGATGVFSFAELKYLRLEAMDLFERCLTEGKPQVLETFIEQQVAHDPPRIELLRDVAEDLHQRLMTLRENHFDVRDKFLRVLRDDFSVDLSPLVPADALEHYHLLDPEMALDFLRKQNAGLDDQGEAVLRRSLVSSLDLAAQLQNDVELTEHLYAYATDWLMALSSVMTRRFWSDTRFDPPPSDIIH